MWMNAPDPSPDLLRLIAEEPFVRSLARDLMADEADEVVQQAYLQALQKHPSVLRSPRQWLARIARNVAANLRRDRHRRRAHENAAAREYRASSTDLQRREERRAQVVRAVDGLPEPYRTAAVLRYYDGMSPRAIAQELGVPPTTIWNRLHKARALLRSQLDTRHGGDRRAWLVPFLLLPNLTVGVVAVTTKLKLAALAAVALGVAAFLIVGSGPPADDGPPGAVTEPGAAMASGSVGGPEPAEPGGAASAVRDPVEAPVAAGAVATTGSLRVQVVYTDGGAPGAGALLALVRVGEPGSWQFPERLRADAEGVALAAGLDPGRFYVRSVTDSNTGEYVDVVAGEEAVLELGLVMGIDVDGIVVDENDVPVGNATVEINHVGQEGRSRRVTETAADGTFVLRAVARVARIGARAPGHAPSKLYSVRGSDGATVPVRIVLSGVGGALSGQVLDPSGEPVAGAIVRVGTDTGETVTRPDGGFMRTPAPFDARTDAEGRFVAFGLASGDQALEVIALPHAVHRSQVLIPAGGAASTVVRLQAAVTVQGTVRDAAGEPVAEVQVRNPAGGAFQRCESDAEGRFVVAGLAAGEISLEAFTMDRGKAATTLHGVAGATLRWDPVLSVGVVLTGRVVDQQEQPVAGALLQIACRGKSWATMAQTDAKGRFRAPNCPPGAPIEVIVHARGFQTLHAESVDPQNGEFVARLERAAERTAFLVGRVIDRDGEPVPNVEVMAVGEGEFDGGGRHTTGADGAFEIGPTPPGNYQLSLRGEGYAHHRTARRRVARGERWDAGAIVLSRGGHVEIELAEQELPTGTKFWIYDHDGRSRGHVNVAKGVTRSQPIEPGSYRLSVSGPEVATQSIEVLIEEGVVSRVPIGLAAGSAARFEFRLPPDYQGRRYVRITIRNGDAVVRDRWRYSRGTGAIEYEEVLAAGSYSIEVTSENGNRGRSEFTVGPTSSREVTVVSMR